MNYVRREQNFLTEVINKDPLSKSDETAINDNFETFKMFHGEYTLAKSLLGVSKLNYKNQNHREAIGRALVFMEHFLPENNYEKSSQTSEFKSAIKYLNDEYGEKHTKDFISSYRNTLGQ